MTLFIKKRWGNPEPPKTYKTSKKIDFNNLYSILKKEHLIDFIKQQENCAKKDEPILSFSRYLTQNNLIGKIK